MGKKKVVPQRLTSLHHEATGVVRSAGMRNSRHRVLGDFTYCFLMLLVDTLRSLHRAYR